MAFNLPSSLYTTARTGPTYSRPSDWPVITDASGEVQFLVNDVGNQRISLNTAFTRTSGNIIVDWGDGNTDTITSNTSTDTRHTYTLGAGTACSRGYTTFKIRVFPAPSSVGVVITTCRPTPSSFRYNQYYSLPVLEAYYGDNTVPAGISSYFSSNGGGNSNANYEYLEYVKMPATVNSNCNYSYAFVNCYNLKKVILPTNSPGVTTWTSTFSGCNSIQSIAMPSNCSPTTLNTICQNCYSLEDITLPSNLNNLTTLANAFTACYSLQNISLPALPACINFNATFQNCYNLTTVKMAGFPTVASTIDFTNCFSACYRLEFLDFPTTISATPSYNFSTTFTQCVSLRTFKLPTGCVATTFNGTFTNCYNLQTCNVVGNGAMNALTSIAGFNNCYNLTSLLLPTSCSTANSISCANFASGCNSLETLTIPTGLGNAFNSIFSLGSANTLRTLILPANMNSVTSIVINHAILENLVMPTSATSCLSMNLGSNYLLREITLPTLPATFNTLACPNNWAVIRYNNMPTTTAITSFAISFTGNYSLKSITLPATVSTAVTSYSAAFQNCFSLETVVLPTTQNTVSAASQPTLTNMFQNCATLSTLTNFDKIQTTSLTPLADATGFTGMMSLPSLTFTQKLSKLAINGSVTLAQQNQITSLRHTATASGQWTGTTPQISVAYTDLTYANLVTFFNDIAAQGTVTTKTIDITGCAGTSSLTAADRLILTSKGWTITG